VRARACVRVFVCVCVSACVRARVRVCVLGGDGSWVFASTALKLKAVRI